jgi:hypothetical protein
MKSAGEDTSLMEMEERVRDQAEEMFERRHGSHCPEYGPLGETGSFSSASTTTIGISLERFSPS